MKANLFASFAATALLAATSAFAAPAPADNHDRDNRYQQGPGDRNNNYGYDRNHRVTPQERARWEAQHRNDKHDDRRDNDHKDNGRRGNDKHDDRRDDKFDRNKNYGFDRDHKVTQDERRNWEQGHNYGYAQNHRVTAQERARWEAQYRRR